MRSSEARGDPEQLLDNILSLLRDDQISESVTGLLDEAGASFMLEVESPMSGQSFNRLLSQFVRHLHHLGLRPPRELAFWQAVSEAVNLLEAYASPTGDTGYDAALADATTGNQELLARILSSILEAEKERRRKAFCQWILASHLDPLAWQLRCEVVSALLSRRRRLLPDDPLGYSPERLAGSCEFLIKEEADSTRYFSDPSAAKRQAMAPETAAVELPLPW